MLRQRLGHGEGMLFVHQPPSEAWMWMQNTPIPLDMIFVAPNGRIVDIIRDARPFSMETIGTHEIVSGVLEVRAGRSEEHTSELQSLMRISYAVFCLKKK